ncbi:MAG: 16S rRNA (cytosine(1402)-N(4))-methyltransferase RsmH [Bacteroidales bacterium]|nr:16S rRNA (cytosine(1402)-N(4))-methyltransferase RsmH [Bacteroidales bacterium]
MTDYHIPALLQTSIDGLNIQGDGVYVDLTFGGGGHSREILSRLTENGKLIAFDTDEDATKNLPDDNRIKFIQSNFRFFINFLEYEKFPPVQGILADLGLSSHHIDVPERGFSYRFDAPLDMRMNQKSGKTAADIINRYSQKKLTEIFVNYGEITKAGKKIAEAVIKQRQSNPIKTTFMLNAVVKNALDGYSSNKILSKLYQALRIEVNQELDVLKDMLQAVPDALSSGGRICIITYHSLEDRIVKNFFKQGEIDGVMINSTNQLTPVNKKVIVPEYKEVKQNKRVRSAKLRIAEKTVSRKKE